MTLKTVPLATLIEDLSIYPRHAVDSTYVGQLVDVLRVDPAVKWKNGPVIVDADSLRIADGWHRCRAYRRVFGNDGSIQVDLRKFKDHAELVRCAVESNIGHGRKLDNMDRVRCALLLNEVGFSPHMVSVTLNMPEATVTRLVLRVATAPAGSPDVVPGTSKMPLKRSAAYLAGMTLTARQAQAHGTLPGTSLSLLARQLVSAIQNDLVDAHNARLLDALRELHAVLGDYLTSRTP